MNIPWKQVSIPANLLLLGEYAVTEEGGFGVCAAVEPRVIVSARESSELSLYSRMAGNETREIDPGDSGQLTAFIIQELGRRGIGAKAELRVSLTIDSHAFFYPSGMKRGFGSSAAVTLGVCAAVLRLSPPNASYEKNELPSIALEIHRAFQGGRGSGYDIFTSYHGGFGLFTGGRKPSWSPLALSWLPGIYLQNQEKSVETRGSISRYENWKQKHPDRGEEFLHDSNTTVKKFADSDTWISGKEHFHNGTRIGRKLGAAISVSAELDIDSSEIGVSSSGISIKALGAGNELAALLAENSQLPSGWKAAPVSDKGLIWE
jgi:phosphomevalonate kinase